jgi:predicted SprT family Zn-dependent metalloprotease
MRLLISISAAAPKALTDYDFAKFAGSRALGIESSKGKVMLRPGDVFGYRDGRKCVYLVHQEHGFDVEWKIAEDTFDNKIGPKSDEVTRAAAKKIFAPVKAPPKAKKAEPVPEKKAPPKAKKAEPVPEKKAPPEKAPAKRRTEVAPPVVKPVVKPQPPVDKKAVAQKSQEAEESTLIRKYGDPLAWKRLKTPASRLSYIKAAWLEVNAKSCQGKLQMPYFRFLKNTGTSFRRRGHWIASKREMAFSPRLFNAGEEIALTVIVHEIAHQAVSEIDLVRDRTAQGHGHNWQTWMRHFGLTPSRYDQVDNLEYMEEHERAAEVKVRENLTKAKTSSEHKRMPYPRDLTPAYMFDARANTYTPGLVVCKHDQAGKRWVFIDSPHYTGRWIVVPPTLLFEMETEKANSYKSEQWLGNAHAIMNAKNIANQRRSAKRADRKDLRNFFGL